jgi:alanyl aminopeptidase
METVTKRKCAAFLFHAACFAALPAHPSFHLPDGVAPIKHTVELSIDPNLPTFEGTATIDVLLTKPAAVIWVNGRNLAPREASVEFDRRNFPAKVEVAGGEFIALQLDSPIGPGSARITIAYQGHLDDHQVLGPYRRKLDGSWYVYTTFTPIEARRAFPCFDEPRFKTPWDISIRVPAGQKAFSNGRELEEVRDADGWTRIHFATTEPLPSEVVAFGVGPFDTYNDDPRSKVQIRVITPKGRSAEGKAAVEAGRDVLPKLEAYTGMPYQFGKLDFLAVAESAFGAVENPGLITFMARELLTVPGTETSQRGANLRLLEAHEISHQWFGDLVTQTTWADVWLSEGFATWVSEKIMDQEQIPERKHLFAIASRERIMKLDESPKARPVRVEVHDREGSKDIYNRMVYDKGGSVLLMLEGWLGEQNVRDAARAYLEEHRFGSATTADFASYLKRATGIDPSAVMHAFLDMSGIPRVNAKVKCDEVPHLEIKVTGPAPVPVCWRTPSSTSQCTVMDDGTKNVRLSSCPLWTYLNAGGTGYYRTSWTAEQLQNLRLDELTAAERMTLAYDLHAQTSDRSAARAVLAMLTKDPDAEVSEAAKAVPR